VSNWAWFFGGYAIFVASLTGYAAHVALSCADSERRADAYKVLKLIWGTATGASGVVAVAVRVHEVGIL
jgi:hypothetical protein